MSWVRAPSSTQRKQAKSLLSLVNAVGYCFLIKHFIFLWKPYYSLNMKRSHLIALIALAVIGTVSCSKSKREKITDPVQQEALRTRDASIPTDSLFTKSALEKIASPFERISIGKFISEYKDTYAQAADKASRLKYAEKLQKEEKLKKEEAEKKAAKADSTALADSRANLLERISYTGDNLPGDGYSTSLTAYFIVVLLLFVIIFTVRVIKAFFISPKKM